MATTTLESLSIGKLNDIVKTVLKNFENRNRLWNDRRAVVFRQQDADLMKLPLSQRAGGNKALMVFQTEEPNQEVHRRVKRLIANKERFEVVIYSTDEHDRQLAQSTKDAIKALWKWMNRAKVSANRRATIFQQRDGLGLFKLDLVSDYADAALAPYDIDALMEEEQETDNPKIKKARAEFLTAKSKYEEEDPDDLESGEKAYHDITQNALRRVNPPMRLSAPDPITFGYTTDGDMIDVYVEKGKRKVSALLEALGPYRVRLSENKFVVWPVGSDAMSGNTMPTPGTSILDKRYEDTVDYTEIRTRTEIAIIVKHPKLRDAEGAKDDGEGAIRVCFENPFGPYSTGCVLVPADVTGMDDPAFEFQPPILGMLNLAQPINTLTTIRLSAAIDAALAGAYIELKDEVQAAPQLNHATVDKTPTVRDGRELPQIPGKVQRVASANVDLDKAESRFLSESALYRFNDALAGDAESSDSGHKLAIQVSQADSQMVPYQNTRAEAIAEVMMCCIYAAYKLGKPIYVKDIPEQTTLLSSKFDISQPVHCITPEMYDLMQNAALIVTIGSETPVTKYAKWAALQTRYEKGTLSFETLMEQSDVENVADETARIFQGQALVAVMKQAIPVIVNLLAARAVQRITTGQNPGVVQEGGNANGGGAEGAAKSLPIARTGKLPGVGMSPAGPPEESPTGGPARPGGEELAGIEAGAG